MMLKQIISGEDCKKCIDPCCKFHETHTEYAPLFSKHEKERIVSRTKDDSVFKMVDKDAYTVHLVKDKRKLMQCPFLKDDKMCGIYDIAPFDCKIWPFGIMSHGKRVFLVVDLDEYCPGLERNQKLGTVEKYVTYLVKFFNTPAKKAMLKKYPGMILPYSKTFKKLQEIKL